MSKTGFTLIELVMVIIIVGLLAAIVIPKFTAHHERSKMVITKSNLDALRKGVFFYYSDNGTYPAMLWHVTQEAVNQGQATKAYVNLPPPQILPVNAFTNTSGSDNCPTVTSCCSSAWCYNWNTGDVFVGRQSLFLLADRLDIEGVDFCTY